MKKIVLFCLFLYAAVPVTAQDIDKGIAVDLLAKNLAAAGLTKEDLNNSIVSNAFFNKTSGTQLVYLQQSYKGLPVLNQVQTFAFKDGLLVSKAGARIPRMEQLTNNGSAVPQASPEEAVIIAFSRKKVKAEGNVSRKQIPGKKKFEFGKLGNSMENVTAELMWVPYDSGISRNVRLAWQVFFAPKKTADMWLLSVDAQNMEVVNEINLTVYCNWDKKSAHTHAEECSTGSTTEPGQSSSMQQGLSPEIINGASYRVVPFPVESPKHPLGTPQLRTDPWNMSLNPAAITLKWHSDGTSDFNYTRGNNAWAYHDRLTPNNPDISKSVTSSTPDPLTFNFTPNFTVVPSTTTPVQNQQFNITNLFYWTNIVHDVMYQYGFDEPSGNFQANNLGRGGVGGDYVRAEAQDIGGMNNANFSTGPDGSTSQVPRMQMYLWDGPSRGLTVTSPAAIAGTYVTVENDFSSANRLSHKGPVSGQVVYYDDDAGSTSHYACNAPTNNISGKIALIDRGFGGATCATTVNFTTKVKNAQLAGAIAVIVVNNVAGAPLIMGGTPADNTITIPAVMITQADGAILAAQISNNLTVTLNQPLDWDGDSDNGIIVHEYGHGISSRLTGGPSQAGCLANPAWEHMGEGWSDYFALMLTQNWIGSNLNTGFTSPRGIGTYANGELPSGLGIRSQRYSTNFAVNNKVYAANIPSSPHDRGEIWCAALWDMTWNIIQQEGNINPNIYDAKGTGGNIIALKLVTEGLKLQPCNPGFIDGRDAILKADQILYNGKYSCAIWQAFARRGMGPGASQGSSQLVNDQVADQNAYLGLSLTQNVIQVPEGQNIIYTNRVTSCGALNNYQLTDTLPSNVTYVSGGTYNAATRVVSFPVNFATAGTQNYVFTVTVNPGSYYPPTTYLDEPVAAPAFPTTLTHTSTTSSVWTVNTTEYHSAPYSLYTPDVVGKSIQILRTANPIALGANQSSLSFWHKYSTEAGFDGGVIEISTDNGNTWSDLGNQTILGHYSGKIDPTNDLDISGKPAYTGASTGFIKTSVNLTPFAGQPAILRWAFYSDLFEGGVGWYVDDILIKNEAVVNMRSSLLNALGVRMAFKDTVTLILENAACSDVVITGVPAATQAVCAGSNASFTVTATGSTPAYQWQVSTNGGGSFTNIPGATSATLNLSAVTAGMNNNQYKVIVSNACPSTMTSPVAILTVTSPTVISLQPTSSTTCSGNNASFSVTATGPGLTYQWQVSTNNGSTWTNITAATSATLTLPAVTIAMNNNQYRVNVSSCIPGGLISNAATLTVTAGAVITGQPASSTACAGSNTSFTVIATGSALNYQWQLSTDGGATFTNMPGATNATLNLPAVTAAMNNNQYKVIVSNACPGGLASSAAILSVSDATTISSQPVNATVCTGDNATFSVTATGSNPSYQWQVSTNAGVTWTNIPGATSSSFTLGSVSASLNNNRYRVLLSSCVAGGVTSNAATLVVNAPVNITTQPANTIGCTGNNVSFTSVVSGSGLTYQWQVSTDAGSTWSNVPGGTASGLTLTSLTAAMNDNRYRLIINGSCSPAALTSNAATLTINNAVTISQHPVNSVLCAGLNTSFSANANGSGLTYQWQVSTNGGSSFANIAGANSPTINLADVTPVMNGNQYRAALTGTCVATLFTNPATLTVNSSVNIVTQPINQAGCAPVPATFLVNATGTSVTYQWEVSTNGGSSWTPVSGATANSLSISSLTPALNGNQYRVIVSGVPCGTLTSNAVTLTIGQLPSVVVTASTTAISPSSSATLTATPSPAGTYSYQWLRDNVPVTGANTNTLVVNIDQLGSYKVMANSSNGCNNLSNEVAITGTTSTRMFVFPNPNTGLFYVRYFTEPGVEPARTINVFSPLGAKIYTKAYTVLTSFDKMEVNITGLPAGVYYIELLDASGKRIATAGVTKF